MREGVVLLYHLLCPMCVFPCIGRFLLWIVMCVFLPRYLLKKVKLP